MDEPAAVSEAVQSDTVATWVGGKWPRAVKQSFQPDRLEPGFRQNQANPPKCPARLGRKTEFFSIFAQSISNQSGSSC
jgi:hypothetical protein